VSIQQGSLRQSGASAPLAREGRQQHAGSARGGRIVLISNARVAEAGQPRNLAKSVTVE
jgi:hypothetical protein